jgi:hypothetical protein
MAFPAAVRIFYFLQFIPAMRSMSMNEMHEEASLTLKGTEYTGFLHPEHIPLKMETRVGRACRWNTLRALRVLRWYNNSTG